MFVKAQFEAATRSEARGLRLVVRGYNCFSNGAIHEQKPCFVEEPGRNFTYSSGAMVVPHC
jgi:hypothetical protein